MGKSENNEYIQCIADILKSTSQAQKDQSVALEKLLILRNYISDHEIDNMYALLYKSYEDNKKVLKYILEMINKNPNQASNITRKQEESINTQLRNSNINQKAGDFFIGSSELTKPQRSQHNVSLQEKSRVNTKYDNLPKSNHGSVFDQLCKDYNDVVDNPSKKSDFAQRYNPIRFGTINAMERRKDQSISPIFQTTNDGDYYAIKMNGNSSYAVFPRFDIDFQDYYYSPGAMGDVFECPDYNYLYVYRKIKIGYPALFEPDSSNNQWKPKQRGSLILGVGE